MEDREWMYTGRRGRNDVTTEWIRKTDDFVERAYGEAAKGASLVPCPCSKCANRKRKPKSAELRQVANDFAYRVKKYSGYDVNGYCFRTTNYDKSRPNRKTTCTGVFTPGLDNVDYFG